MVWGWGVGAPQGCLGGCGRPGGRWSISLWPALDHRLSDFQASPQRDRGPAQGHREAGEQHQGAPRHVHGHRHAGGEPGEAVGTAGAGRGRGLRLPEEGRAGGGGLQESQGVECGGSSIGNWCSGVPESQCPGAGGHLGCWR